MFVLYLALAVLAVFIAARILMHAAFPLPDLDARASSTAIPLDPSGTWGRFLAAQTPRPGKSGLLLLSTGHEALASRLFLVRSAERTIDVQCYIWRDDVSGRLLLRALLAAARRGVRVRLLLDDNGVAGMDATLAALDAEDNFEVRLFNPATIRRPKLLPFLLDFVRMNRRMHNKALIVDGAATIVGGRNVGDEYFVTGSENYFLDLDVLAVGAIVPETAANFDRFWAGDASFPARGVIGNAVSGLPDWLASSRPSGHAAWLDALPEPVASAAARLESGEATLEWCDVTLLSDPPAKGLGAVGGDQLMIRQIANAMGTVERRLDMISAYLVPGRRGIAFMRLLRRRGADVTVITNALKSTDVALVHAGYAKYRRRLVRAGVKLYELKRAPAGGDRQSPRLGGSLSGSSLHAKTLNVDGRRLFVGSFNYDPRSVYLNCEMGFMIESEALARTVGHAFTRGVADGAYRVVLRRGRLNWIETGPDGREIVHVREPETTLGERAAIVMFGWLPIEWLL